MMADLVRQEILAFDDAREALQAALSQRTRERSRDRNDRIIRVAVAVRNIDPLSWLAAQTHDVKIFWSDRTRQTEVAAVGVAAHVRGSESPGNMLDRAAALAAAAPPNVRIYGGMAFDADAPPGDLWSAFGPAWFMLPRIELRKRGPYCVLAYHCVVDNDASEETPLDIAAGVIDSLRPEGPYPVFDAAGPQALTEEPNQGMWTRHVQDALGRIRENALKKIVLARKTRVEFEHEVNGLGLLALFASHAPKSSLFYMRPARGVAFLGASPERLYRRRGRLIETEAVAGTRPRSLDPEMDRVLGEQLLTNAKEQREHKLVIEAIRHGLSILCESFDGDSTMRVLRLRECQHLYASLTGRLQKNISDSRILRVLHPTPAVGGCPTQEALAVIRHMESFSRGWYAGPVGWMSRDAAEFAVAIRSALITGKRLHIFAGAGIVEGSVAEREWAELDTKMGTFHHLFAGNHGRRAES